MSESLFEMKLEGLEAVMSVLQAIPVELERRAIDRMTYKIGKQIAGLLRSEAPRGTHPAIRIKNAGVRKAGNLKRSIKAVKIRQAAIPTYSIRPRAFYARFLEYPSKGRGGEMRPAGHPWLYSAWAKINKEKILSQNVDILKNEIARVLKYKVK